jgi:hypothetical protein
MTSRVKQQVTPVPVRALRGFEPTQDQACSAVRDSDTLREITTALIPS